MRIYEELGNRGGIAEILIGFGNIHYQQGGYDIAVKLYQESMRIAEELGDRGRIALAFLQMGKVFYTEKNYKEALRYALFASIIFNELNSPYKDVAGNNIMKLKEELGEELFNKYYQEITSDEQREKDSN